MEYVVEVSTEIFTHDEVDERIVGCGRFTKQRRDVTVDCRNEINISNNNLKHYYTLNIFLVSVNFSLPYLIPVGISIGGENISHMLRIANGDHAIINPPAIANVS